LGYNSHQPGATVILTAAKNVRLSPELFLWYAEGELNVFLNHVFKQ